MTDDRGDGLDLAGSSAGVTLASILDALSDAVVGLTVAPIGLQVVVRNVVILDDPQDILAGDLVLGVGVDPHGSGATATLEHLAGSGAAGVVVKCTTDPPAAVVDRAAELGLALLSTSVHVDWGQLYTLLRTATAANAFDTASTDGVRAVPLGDLFALANAAAAAVGGATTIEDRQLQVLAHSNLGHPVDRVRLDSIVGRKVPEDVRRETVELYREVWKVDEVVRIRAHRPSGSRARLAVAIRVGAEVLGTIWVLQGERPFNESDERALLEVSRMAALHLMRHAAAGDVERRQRGEMLRSVLEGRVPFRTVAPSLGDRTRGHFTVVVMTLLGERGDEIVDTRDADRFLDIVALHVGASRSSAAMVRIGLQVYVVLFDDGTSSNGPLREFVAEMVARAGHALKRVVVAGIGSTAADRERFAAVRRDADAALRVARSGTNGPVVHVDDVRTQVAILRFVDLAAADPELRTDLFSRLAEHDRTKGSDYATTIEAFLDAGGNVTEAAGALFVHPNTLRYRLKRMAETTGVDVDDADTRFLLALEQRIARAEGA